MCRTFYVGTFDNHYITQLVPIPPSVDDRRAVRETPSGPSGACVSGWMFPRVAEVRFTTSTNKFPLVVFFEQSAALVGGTWRLGRSALIGPARARWRSSGGFFRSRGHSNDEG